MYITYNIPMTQWRIFLIEKNQYLDDVFTRLASFQKTNNHLTNHIDERSSDAEDNFDGATFINFMLVKIMYVTNISLI